MAILGKSSTNSVIPSTILLNSSSKQQNYLTSSSPQLLSTIIKTVRHLSSKIDSLIQLLDNQQNVFEINKKKQVIKFTLASPLITPQPRLILQHLSLLLPLTSQPRLH